MFFMFDETVCQKVPACLLSYSQREIVVYIGYVAKKLLSLL